MLQKVLQFLQGVGASPEAVKPINDLIAASNSTREANNAKSNSAQSNSAQSKLTGPPSDIVSKGRVEIKNPDHTNLPGSIKARSLYLKDCKTLEKLPKVDVRRLVVTECGALKELPEKLDLWELELVGAAVLRKLPADLKVRNRLVLRDCTALEELPEGLSVGSLILTGCSSLKALPENLTVDFLDVSDCLELTDWPKNAKVTVGRFSARNCIQLRELPPWVVNVSQLDLSGCTELRSIPEGVRVSSWIDIGGTALKSLPASMAGVQIRWRRVPIDERIAFRPESLTAEEILATRNIELRRVMMERMGYEKFMKEANAEVLDEDTDAGGKRQLLKVPIENDEDLVCVSVFCPSTGKHYIIRVPPGAKNCHEAVAWIAGFDDPTQYKLVGET